ncbi:MAG: ATPase, T2SS/T4P/T4SS family, partial [Candidatus Aenigmatarchaeota archaeon]
MQDKVLDSYKIHMDEVTADVQILRMHSEFVPIYKMTFPKVEPATAAVLDVVREKLLIDLTLKPENVMTKEEHAELRATFFDKAMKIIGDELPKTKPEERRILAEILTHKSLGLGEMEILLKDDNLEEIVVNSSKEPVWVYHRKLGWLKTDLVLPTETAIYNYSASIGRKVGTQITNLNPLMDAYLTSGDRANATLFPISSMGNTMTIRKFARRPWTITDFIEANTISPEVAAFLWLAIQYEMNVLIVGGTASGKTSLLNVLSCFIPPTHRVISIEDTRELQLPKYLHWVPLTTRPPNPEGKGEVTMLDLMVNSLRMRPDRILVGEIRRSREAETLFEAIHTGHSVYSTIHANTAEETIRRLTNPPISIPESMLGALDIIAVMHRDRRRDIRRVLEVAEIASSSGDLKAELNITHRWVPSRDKIMEMDKPSRTLDE